MDDDPATSGAPDIAAVGQDRYLVWYDRRSDPGYGVYFSKWEDEAHQIPTLSEWGMLILTLLLMATATIAVLRRKTASKPVAFN